MMHGTGLVVLESQEQAEQMVGFVRQQLGTADAPVTFERATVFEVKAEA